MARYAAMLRRLFTWRMNLYRLMVGAIVLAIVIPSWEFRVKAMWLVALGCILVVIGAVGAGTRVPSIREWLRR
jgi:cell division protein FtsW (lipid II flippase)